jgi:hypothetical protein
MHVPGRGKRVGIILAAWVMAVLCLAPAVADEQTDRRILVGLKLFPAVLAADTRITEKTAPDGRLHLAVVYKERADMAEHVAEHLRKAGSVRDIPLAVNVVTYAGLAALTGPPAGVFLAEWAPQALPGAVRLGTRTGSIVFSPFRGDVALGAHAGVFVGDRILPLVNPAALKASGIQLKPFFLEVARTHE